jgi:hypothetical protein
VTHRWDSRYLIHDLTGILRVLLRQKLADDLVEEEEQITHETQPEGDLKVKGGLSMYPFRYTSILFI